MDHLYFYNVLHDSQHGFRKKRGCDTQLVLTTSDLNSSLDNNKQVDAVLLDFSKAFDRVSHTRLLLKLKHYGITGNVLGWLESFLTQHKQCVVLDDKMSSTLDVTSSVPQGTVIGPLCFLVYMTCLIVSQLVPRPVCSLMMHAFVYRELNNPDDSQ